MDRSDVFEAAEKVRATGEKVTLVRVREITGGSYSTISPFLKEWKKIQEVGKDPDLLGESSSSPPIPIEVQDLFANVWKTSLFQSELRMKGEREQLGEERRKNETDRMEWMELAEDLQHALDQEKSKSQELSVRLEQSEKERERLNLRLAESEGAIHILREWQATQESRRENTPRRTEKTTKNRLAATTEKRIGTVQTKKGGKAIEQTES